MLGPAKPRRLDQPIAVSLEDLAATGWGRRHAPCGSLLAFPLEPGRLLRVYG